MNKLLAAGAAACLAFTCLPGSGAIACDEDCAYEMQEAAYERAEAREEAAEEGYYPSQSRGDSRSMRRREQAAGKSAQRRARKSAAGESSVTEPKSEPDPEPKTLTRSKRGTAVVNENSSISNGSSRFAEDDTVERVSTKPVGCKTYFPSVGMTISVPCD
jgi:hypothetical protein